jgi:patatin-like phospholipase/acyl hydrolase
MKRILTIDGGGSRGLFALQILRKIEEDLPIDPCTGEKHHLNSYFDLMAGTSTGAIIASLLRWGKSVNEIEAFYERHLGSIFELKGGVGLLKQLCDPHTLSKELQQIFGSPSGLRKHNENHVFWQPGTPLPDWSLGSDRLGADRGKYLMIVTLRAETLSPWPLTNHPKAKYNDIQRFDCNLQIPLWQLVRASTAAPIFFPPQRVWLPHSDGKAKTVGKRTTLGTYCYFVDGGVSGYNNPAHLAYRMATLPEYPFQWSRGLDKLKIVSVGTGDFDSNARRPRPDRAFKIAAFEDGTNTICYLMALSALEQDIQCRTIGRTLAGHEIDRELKSLDSHDSLNPRDMFTYCRYQKQFSNDELVEFRRRKAAYDFTASSENSRELFKREGKKFAESVVEPSHFI